jgi:hypothetical protein
MLLAEKWSHHAGERHQFGHCRRRTQPAFVVDFDLEDEVHWRGGRHSDNGPLSSRRDRPKRELKGSSGHAYSRVSPLAWRNLSGLFGRAFVTRTATPRSSGSPGAGGT